MAQRICRCLFFFFLLLFSFSIYCSGNLVGLSNDSGSGVVASFIVNTAPALKLNKASLSRIQYLLSNFSVLDTPPNPGMSVDIYLTQTQFGDMRSYKASLVPWLKIHLRSFMPKLRVRSVIVRCSTGTFSRRYELKTLLSILRSIHSLLNGLQLEKTVKVSVSFPLPMLKSLNTKRKRDVDQILHFLRKTNSFVVVEDCTNEKFSGAIVHRKLLTSLDQQVTKHDLFDPPTMPSNLPPFSSTPTIITIPSTNPIPITPTNPTSPVTNPVTTYPSPLGGVPVTSPFTAPVTPPPVTTNPPQLPGQTWCIAKSGVAESALQGALDYACGIVDCSMIQQGASCYDPNTLENHASFAFNSYFLKNPVATSCDFGGAAVVVNTDPSSGSCVYPSAAATAMPTMVSPATTTSSSGATGTDPGYGSPPSIFNPSSNPTSGSSTGYGSEFPPLIVAPPSQSSASEQSYIDILILITSLAMGLLVDLLSS